MKCFRKEEGEAVEASSELLRMEGEFIRKRGARVTARLIFLLALEEKISAEEILARGDWSSHDPRIVPHILQLAHAWRSLTPEKRAGILEMLKTETPETVAQFWEGLQSS